MPKVPGTKVVTTPTNKYVDASLEVDLNALLKEVNDVKTKQSKRTEKMAEHEKMYFMDTDDLPGRGDDGIKDTISPTPKNKIDGGARLISATRARFSVPMEKVASSDKNQANKLEVAADIIMYQSGQIRQKSIEEDAAFSALLYGEVHISITDTDVLKEAYAASDEAERFADIASQTPTFLDIVTPVNAFPILDRYGVKKYFQYYTVPIQAAIDEWAGAAKEFYKGKETKTGDVTIVNWWDYGKHVVFDIANTITPILAKKNEGKSIPFVVKMPYGSPALFSKADQWSQPLLEAVRKSNLWKRHNAALTVIATTIFAIGANGMLVYKSDDKDGELHVDHSIAGGLVRIGINESLLPLMAQVIDPNLYQAISKWEELITESTFYNQAFGQALPGSQPFSSNALFSQAGRLPLVPVQRACEAALQDAMVKAFKIIKKSGKKIKMRSATDKKMNTVEIKSEDVPDNLIIEAMLRIGTPQDDAQNLELAMKMSSGEDPMTSKRYAREKLDISNSPAMTQEIWDEQFGKLNAMNEYAKRQQEINENIKKIMGERAQLEAQAQAKNSGAGGGYNIGRGMVSGGLPTNEAPIEQQAIPEETMSPEGAPVEPGASVEGAPAAPATQPLSPGGAATPAAGPEGGA